jgi:hypothetical protein
MRLVERHIIKRNNKWFGVIDQMSFLSKNLFNCAVYLCRQAFFNSQPIPTFNQIYHSLMVTLCKLSVKCTKLSTNHRDDGRQKWHWLT